MSQDRIMSMFDSLSEDEQVEFVKQVLIEKINTADCWKHCDLRAVLRIVRVMGNARRRTIATP